MKRVLGLLVLGLVLGMAIAPLESIGVTEITDVGPKGPPHVFVIPAGQDSTYHPNDFNYNAAGGRDLDQITAIGYRNTDATADTLYINIAERGIFKMLIPPSAVDSWSQRVTNLTAITGDADSTVLRYVAVGATESYLYVWGN